MTIEERAAAAVAAMGVKTLPERDRARSQVAKAIRGALDAAACSLEGNGLGLDQREAKYMCAAANHVRMLAKYGETW